MPPSVIDHSSDHGSDHGSDRGIDRGIDHGTVGISAQSEFERRLERHERRIEQTWGTGHIGRIAKFMSETPQSTTAWAKGAEGERRLATRLDAELHGRAVVLHDRHVPGSTGNIDHIVIAPSGLWIIDAKHYSGKVVRRDVGGWFKTDVRLFVGGHDQTRLTASLAWQVDAARKVLQPMGIGAVPIHPALCFVDAGWPWRAKPQQVRGVWTISPTKLCELILEPGPLTLEHVDAIARELSSKLPASR